jgi:chromosomal replication initiator protein
MALFNLEHWQLCLDRLREELQPQQFSTWILPLQAESQKNELVLLAPNTYIVDVIKERFFEKIVAVVKELFHDQALQVSVEVGSTHGSKTQSKKSKAKRWLKLASLV